MQLSSPNADASPFERRVPSSSTLKGTLHKTPPRRRPPELQHTGLEPGTKLHGGMPPTHSEETKTMIKSKRLEPCGRCQVMTAVRVALPCGRLVNLCIPCASTFARFLSKRIRDLARDSCYSSSDKRADQREGTTPSREGRERSGGKPRAASKEKGPKGKILEGHGRGSPLEMANEQLQALDASSVGKVQGRGKGQIPDNAGGGLSPTFRARKASPKHRYGKDAAWRSQNLARRDMQLTGSCASPMIVADSGLTSPFARTPSVERSREKPIRSSQSSAQLRDLDSPSAWSAASTSKTWVSRSGKQSGSISGASSGQAHLGAQPDPSSPAVTREKKAQHSAAAAACGTNFGGARSREEEERERHVLPHGRTLVHTCLSDSKAPTYFPELKGARTDVQPHLPRMYSDGNGAGGHVRDAAGGPVRDAGGPQSQGLNSWRQQGAHKEPAVRRERGPGRGVLQHADGAVAALDKFDQKMSPKSSRRHADLADSAKEIRRRMMQDLRGSNGPSGSPGLNTWSNGGSGGSGKKSPGSMPLKFVLSSGMSS